MPVMSIDASKILKRMIVTYFLSAQKESIAHNELETLQCELVSFPRFPWERIQRPYCAPFHTSILLYSPLGPTGQYLPRRRYHG